jgi:hypothetical protein
MRHNSSIFIVFVSIKGFWYPGILKNIGGICLFILFSLLSFQNNKIIFLFLFSIKNIKII